MTIEVIILAAGKGTRMASTKPKVLQLVAGKTMLDWQLQTLKQTNVASVTLVVGHGAIEVEQAAARYGPWVRCVRQAKQLGTGHATSIGLGYTSGRYPVVVMVGDIPFISTQSITRLGAMAQIGALALLTTTLDNPYGYGRVLKLAGDEVDAIVEEKDADSNTKNIREVFCGVLAAPPSKLTDWIKQLDNNNAQQEYYLPEVVTIARNHSHSGANRVLCVPASTTFEASGINAMRDIVKLERAYMLGRMEQLLDSGTYIADPTRVELRGDIDCKKSVSIDVNCVFEGKVVLSQGVKVGAHCVLKNCHVGNNSVIEPFTYIENAWIGDNCIIGPYARLRNDARIQHHARVGNFVEVKQSTLGSYSKASHLSYVGNATIGEGTNIGAGTITCNYDGYSKNATIIGDESFIGSNSSLIAPVNIGDKVVIGAGSVITTDVPSEHLALGRSRQTNKTRKTN